MAGHVELRPNPKLSDNHLLRFPTMIASQVFQPVGRSIALSLAIASMATLLTGLSAAAAVENVHRSAAVVNDIPISAWDVDQRTKLVMASSGAPNSKEVYDKISEQVLRTLIDEQLQIQEASEKKVNITAQDVKEAMERIARSNNTTLAKISETLDAAGVEISALESQVRAELAWSKLVSQTLSGRVRVSETEVEATFIKLQEGSTQPQYQVAQIFVPVERPEDEDDAKATAENLLMQVRATRSFANVARQFSKDITAASGGDMGWITLDELAPELASALKVLSIGQMTVPTRAKGGYYILLLRDMRVPAGTKVEGKRSTLPPGQINITQVTVPSQGGGQEGLKKAMTVAEQIRSQITGCQGVGSVTMGRAKVIPYGVMSLGMIQEDLRNMLPTLPNDGTSPVGVTPDGGATFFIVCDGGKMQEVKEIPAPKKEDIEDRIYSQQLSVLARRYLRDLRRDAVVEMR
jgi:peptidyl-prolyl cis-trans isomerase SurA